MKYPKSSTSGTPLFLGATWQGTHWNFAVFSNNPILHLVIAKYETPEKQLSFPLNSSCNKTGAIWHIAIQDLPKRFFWGWRVETENGAHLSIDPYAHLLYTGSQWGENRWKQQRDSGKEALFAVATQPEPFAWTAKSPHKQHADHIIYETHVRGFTKDHSSHVSSPGTWSGYSEKLDYLQSLGVTALELLPIFEFDETEWMRKNPKTGEDLFNFWGYSPLHFFSPMQRYSSFEDPIEASLECKRFIDECHKRSLAVILDVVYNHTGEGNEEGPSYSLKLLAENDYYIMNDEGRHTNYSGCGNSLNVNNPMTRKLLITSLHHWVVEYNIDGFRFDLAGSFFRGMNGAPLSSSPLLQDIAHDPLLQSKLLIFEPWDAGGLYKTGALFRESSQETNTFLEWNDRFRDDIRRYIRGDLHMKGLFATRLSGSEDMYTNPTHQLHTINYVTAHDGFTLHDLVSYATKQNWENAEDNRDGTNENFSSSYDNEEGAKITHLQEQQMKNFFLALLLSHGIPLLHQGDEYGHSKQGNNNSWCHDTQRNWFQWDHSKQQKSLIHFVSKLIAFRKESHTLRSSIFLKKSDIDWHGLKPFAPHWEQADPYIGFTAKRQDGTAEFYAGFSPSNAKKTITLPSYEEGSWELLLSTHPLTQPLTHSSIQKIHIAPFSAFILTWKPKGS